MTISLIIIIDKASELCRYTLKNPLEINSHFLNAQDILYIKKEFVSFIYMGMIIVTSFVVLIIICWRRALLFYLDEAEDIDAERVRHVENSHIGAVTSVRAVTKSGSNIVHL